MTSMNFIAVPRFGFISFREAVSKERKTSCQDRSSSFATTDALIQLYSEVDAEKAGMARF